MVLSQLGLSPREAQSTFNLLSKSKRFDYRSLTQEDLRRLRVILQHLYREEELSTTEIASRLHRSQYFVWQLCRRLGIALRSPAEGGRLYVPKRTQHPRTPFAGSPADRAYLQGFAQGDLDVRRVSGLAIMVSSTTTHPAFARCFESLFGPFGPIYVYPIHDKLTGYKWKVAARLDDSFSFLLPSERRAYPDFRNPRRFFAWLAGLVDSDGSIGITHAKEYVRINLFVSNQDLALLEYLKEGLLDHGYAPSGPYATHAKGEVTPQLNIRYNRNFYFLYLQRAEQVKKVLRLIPVRHEEKLRRKELVLGLPTPALWKTAGESVLAFRRNIRDAVRTYCQTAEDSYKNVRRERSPGRLSQP